MSESKGAPRGFVLVPAGTFLLGLLLGAVLVWVAVPGGGTSAGGEQDPTPGTTGGPAASPTLRASPGPGTTIPESCVRSAESAATAVTLVRQAVTAVGDLDAARLQQIVDRIEQLDTQIREDVTSCRRQTGQLEPDPSPGSAPRRSPTATGGP